MLIKKERKIKILEDLQIQTINKKEEAFPQRLKKLKDCPEMLYAVGNIELLNKASIAIVGSRNADDYGKEQAKRFASFLSQKGICIVSGLARGIDSIAHINSKSEVGKTIAVIASGFNHIYPPENKKLFQEIIEEGGLIISEWEPDEVVDMGKFPRRNRIISGLTLGTLLVESIYRSGSNITANFALKQKRELFCIPGNIDSTKSYGPNNFISKGANIVTSPRDILDYYEYSEIDEFANQSHYKAKVDPKYLSVYNEIGDVPISPNEISENLNKNVREINEVLFILEMDGFIKRIGVGKFVRGDEE